MTIAIASGLRAVAVLAFSLALASPAYADNGHWHGVRSSNWHDGIQAGQSNWYDKPPGPAIPVGVPDRTALFEDGAVTTNVIIAQPATIRQCRFPNNNSTYTFQVNANFTLTGAGVSAIGTDVYPLFTVNEAIMQFTGESTMGRADYVIKSPGTVDITGSTGPEGKRVLIAHKVDNEGRLLIGVNRLNIQTQFRQQPGARLRIEITQQDTGRLKARGARLGGMLIVEGRPGLNPGMYQVVESNNRRGKFGNVDFQGFGNQLVTTLVYQGDDVFVKVENAP